MKKAYYIAVIIALCSTFARPTEAQKQETRFSFAGADAGGNVYEMKPDGTFESVSNLSIAGMKITSKLTGKITDGLLTEYELEQTQAGVSGKVSARAGKLKAEAAGNKKEQDYKPGKVLFANFHPALSATLAKAFSVSAADSQRIELMIVDGGIFISIDLVKRPAKTVEVAGVKHVVQVFQARFPSVDMEIYVDDSGRTVAWNVPTQTLKAIVPGFEDLVVDPTTKMPELSQPTFKTKTEKSVKIKMRDSTELTADIARPDGIEKYPAILIRTPYGRGGQMASGDWWAKRGYVLIAQDCRGRGDSAGEWEPFVHERTDGYDTIDWISKQPWSNGSVGMIGGSYVGWVQWWAAVECHPALKCIVPQVSPPDPFFNVPIDHGIPFLYGGVWWAAVVKDKGPLTALPKLKNLEGFKQLPISKVDDAVLGADIPFVDRWWQKDTAASFGPANFSSDLKKVKIPALHISGWWDGDGIGTKMNWAAMRALGRTNQWLIYGPWTHAFNTTSRLGDTDYGPNAIMELESVYLRWFDTWLKGKQVGLEKMPKARVFVTGANEWRDLNGWPDSRSTEKKFYLSTTGPANGPESAGKLTETPPASPQEPDRYTYNPAHATIPKELTNQDPGEASTVVKLDPHDQSSLFYRTASLEKPIAMGGPIAIDLYISTSAVDTDFYGTVVDVDEKGEIRAIGRPGKIRAKYFKSFDKPELLKPGRIYKLTLAHWDTAHQFMKGHRIGLLVSSDGFPVYARNLGTGESSATGTRMVAQHETIYHDSKHPSALRFRVLPSP